MLPGACVEVDIYMCSAVVSACECRRVGAVERLVVNACKLVQTNHRIETLRLHPMSKRVYGLGKALVV